MRFVRVQLEIPIMKKTAFGVVSLFSLCLTSLGAVTVVVPPQADRAVRVAADAFADCHEKVTGVRPAVDVAATGEGPFVRISSDAAAFAGETDAYRIRSTADGLELVGRNGRSAIYAVYDFFRRRCGAAYFWDGDVFEKAPRIDFSGLDVLEQSRFEYRACQYFAHRGLTRFNAEHWGFEDWKKEIDWAVKNRLNVVRLCLGIEDLFQRAFPDVVPYPDPAVTQETDSEKSGYDLRTPFWSLEYRSLLRKAVFAYAMERGLSLPVEFGPQTHWYARTPKEFLETQKPDFMPQIDERYSQPSGLMWDCRKDKWFDAYFKLSEAALDTYGYSGLLFNPGFDERTVYSNREDNVSLKIQMLRRFNDEATRRHPDAKLLMEGWDFYLCWKPEEMRRLTEALDPKTTVIWDFMADADGMRCYPWIPEDNNFTQWGVTNRFPYVFGYTLAHERGLDIRCNYERIREREAAMRDDPMCKGYCIWPENSHTDIFAWRYFTDNCWKLADRPLDDLLAAFCRDRYGRQAAAFERAWKLLIPDSRLKVWSSNFLGSFIGAYDWSRNSAGRWSGPNGRMVHLPAKEILAALGDVDWEGEFVRRDALDIVRTVLDRKLMVAFEELMQAYHGCRAAKVSAAEVKAKADRHVALLSALTDLLELHTDYSVAESFDRLNAVERIRNPAFERVLFENSSCQYCMSHQFEYAKGWYLPRAKEIAALLTARAATGDFSPLPEPSDGRERMRRTGHPLKAYAPDPARRTKARFDAVMKEIRALF